MRGYSLDAFLLCLGHVYAHCVENLMHEYIIINGEKQVLITQKREIMNWINVLKGSPHDKFAHLVEIKSEGGIDHRPHNFCLCILSATVSPAETGHSWILFPDFYYWTNVLNNFSN